MRYTAKARMLSFNFLIDDVVYALPPKQVVLLAGMITRADNLGRMPGEPEVLLAYLFSPRSPRPDVTHEDLRELLVRLATARPPVVAWYRHKTATFVEFMRWTHHQSGLREHNKRSSYPASDAAGSVAVAVPSNLTEPLPFEEHAVTSGMKIDLGKAIKVMAQEHALAAATGEFDAQRVKEWTPPAGARGVPAPDAAVAFGHWLWKGGTTNMDAVIALLDEWARLGPENPYAYFSVGGAARDGIVARFSAAQQVTEHEREKRETETFLHGKEAVR